MTPLIRRLLLPFALVLLLSRLHSEPLPQDRGSVGVWQKLLKLRTTASLMLTIGQPDEEHGGMLALLGRGQGVRTALLTFNRGEGGDNAIGSELFDALGLLRTEEMLRAGRLYGVDDQYFTSAIDFGFSKRPDEALDKWGREQILRDVVHVIRVNRPLVLISRFQGTARDGHGASSAAALITREAFRAAGDAGRFSDQLSADVGPWQPLKLYRGGAREDEDWTVRVDTGQYSPWLGDTYNNVGRAGLNAHRSQNGARYERQTGSASLYYQRLDSVVAAPMREASLFDGIDVTLPGLFAALRKPAPGGVVRLLSAIDGASAQAAADFRLADPSASVPALVRGLAATRAARSTLSGDADASALLRIKESQFMEAITAALGLEWAAVAQPAGTTDTGSSASGVFTAPPVMGPVTPGQTFEVRVTLTNPSRIGIVPLDYALFADAMPAPFPTATPLNAGRTLELARETVSVPSSAKITRPYFSRASVEESRYVIEEEPQRHRAAAASPFVAVVHYTVDGQRVEIREPIRRREAQLPDGYVLRDLTVVPAVAVKVNPSLAIAPLTTQPGQLTVQVDLLGNRPTEGRLQLRLPAGWRAEPAGAPFHFARAGEESSHRFLVSTPAIENRTYRIDAVASIGAQEYTEGYEVVAHRDLEARALYHPASVVVRGIDVRIPPGLRVGYVMGAGDSVPSGIAQLGARVQLLSDDELARGDLSFFDAIVTGTRAYGIRPVLKTAHARLMAYVRDGGHLIVLYNTPSEFDPSRFAPYPADLPRDAEEVSEEDAPVQILAAGHRLLHVPNEIGPADFEGWVEQRGSKFFNRWDAAYTALLETHDRGQAPQRGGWLTADVGRGHYTYCAFALHRQLPFGVPGAYRLLANLLSLGRSQNSR